MDARRYEHIKALLASALGLPGDQRLAYLQRECGDDDDLAREVVDLLARDPGDAEADQDSTVDDSGAIRSLVGQNIDGYHLVRIIGEGGMGIVFLAEQTRPLVRRVAFKIIKIGMDTREVVARFDSERQALAMMNHPNVARVLDAGATDTGRPYFVMEYIPGESITSYCVNHKLGIEARLRLFVQVCRGIHHAHQRGIIHRDIKPGNVLITQEDGEPVVKVIDFGIAKATNRRLTEQTVFTYQGRILGTPEYMSPEQADFNEHDIDTRCDVYSLGVLLYEMLTGYLPIPKEDLLQAGLARMYQQLQDHEPIPPSTRIASLLKRGAEESRTLPPTPKTWSARLKRDLDWVTMKALEKNRERRYESPGALAEDLERYLSDMPVEAGPPSRLYRARKFVQRYRAIVATTGLIVVMLIAGVIGTTTGMVRADRAENEARLAARRSEAGRLFELARNEGLPSRAQATLLKAVELDDRPEFRRRVRRNLLREPPMHRLPVVPDSHNPLVTNFSPDGRWLAVGWNQGGSLQLFPLPAGSPVLLEGHVGAVEFARFTGDSNLLVTAGSDSTLRIWNPDTAKQVDIWRLEGYLDPRLCRDDSLLIVGEIRADNQVRWWSRPLLGGKPIYLGSVDNPLPYTVSIPFPAVDPDGRWLSQPRADRILLFDLHDLGQGPLREIGHHPRRIAGAVALPEGGQVLSYDAEGLLQIWNVSGDGTVPVRSMQSGANPYFMRFSRDGQWLTTSSTVGLHVWDRTQSTAVRPTIFRATPSWTFDADFHPTLPWLVTTQAGKTTAAWSLVGWSRIDLELPDGESAVMRFTDDGRTLITASDIGVVTSWPLNGTRIGEPRQLGIFPGHRFWEIQIDEANRACYLVPCNGYEGMGTLVRVPLDGGQPRSWTGASCWLEISADGRFAATGAIESMSGLHARILDLENDVTVDLVMPDGGATTIVGFVADGRVLAFGPAGLGLWNPDGTGFVRLDETPVWAELAGDRRTFIYRTSDGSLRRRTLGDPTTESLFLPPTMVETGRREMDRSGSKLVVSNFNEEIVFVDLDRGYVQRLPVADTRVSSIAFDPTGRWIACSHDGMVTLLPIPDEPLPDDLPHEDYIQWLASLTNLRLVENGETDSGYQITGSGAPDWSRPPR